MHLSCRNLLRLPATGLVSDIRKQSTFSGHSEMFFMRIQDAIYRQTLEPCRYFDMSTSYVIEEFEAS